MKTHTRSRLRGCCGQGRPRSAVLLAAFSCAWLCAVAVVSADEAPRAATSPRLRDVQGNWQEPLQPGDHKATVLLFTTVDCPVANAFAPEIHRIVTDYAGKGVKLHLVHVDPDVTPAGARKHAQEYGYKLPVLLDAKHELVRRSGATITPEAAVFDVKGELVYRGRINNRYEDYGVKRQEPTRHDLREALDAVLAGKPVPSPHPQAVGCFIPAPIRSKSEKR
jgi:thiol-disulfide isomerase/thioredoxin